MRICYLSTVIVYEASTNSSWPGGRMTSLTALGDTWLASSPERLLTIPRLTCNIYYVSFVFSSGVCQQRI